MNEEEIKECARAKMISYYELLGMVKDKTNPKKVKLIDDIYTWNDMNYFCEHIGDYLTAMMHEIEVFDKNIEIIEEDKDIKEIKINGDGFYSEYIEGWIKKEHTDAYCEYLSNKMNELIREINKLRREDK